MIDVQRLTKVYEVPRKQPGFWGSVRGLFRRETDAVRAVDGISFAVGEGEIVGFLGPNGAGKTTTLKMLSGLLEPTAGTVSVLGHVPRARARGFLSAITLVMGQKQQLLWDLPPRETFELNRAIYNIPDAEYRATLNELTGLLEVGDLMARPTRNLSLGERMKCELCAALIHRPRVLFLDEPTIGLDVGMQATVREFVRSYNERFGATVLLTSHYMADVEALCPRVVVIDGGSLQYDGDLQALIARSRPEKEIALRFREPVAAGDLAGIGTLKAHAEMSATLLVPRAEAGPAVAALLARLPVADLTVDDPPLEEVMRQLFDSSRKVA